MKRIVEINYGSSITVNRGNYENWKPMWHQKVTLELNGAPLYEVEAIENAEFERIKSKLDKFANDEFEKSKLDASHLRIRVKDGKRYVSVNSILHPEPLPIDPEFAMRGTGIHQIFNTWLDTGKWEKPSIELKKLSYEDIKYKEFFEKFKDRINFKNHKKNIEVFHEVHFYSGEIDVVCEVDGIASITDLKCGAWDWTQLIAYYKAHNSVKQLVIFDLKNQKLEILSLKDPKCQVYWEKFLIKRGETKSRFGV